MADWKPGDPCTTCNRVTCKCIKCPHCNVRTEIKDICAKCQLCRNYHTEWYPKDFPHRKCDYTDTIQKTNTFIVNPLHRTIGVEIELGSFGAVRQQESNNWINWELVHDGSVADSGQELVTTRMNGDRYIYGMTKLVSDLNSTGACSNETCGYHVHVDAAELTPFDLRRIMVAFRLIQDDLYGTLVSRDRLSEWGRQYCMPLKCDPATVMAIEDKTEFVDWLHNWLYGVKMPSKSQFSQYDQNMYRDTLHQIDAQLKQYKNTKYINRARRWALNFHSWMMRGTLEFRLKEGTINMEDLLMWPLWCAWFVQRIGSASDKEAHYWLKKGLGVMGISEFLADSPNGMPNYVLEWVRRKCNNG